MLFTADSKLLAFEVLTGNKYRAARRKDPDQSAGAAESAKDLYVRWATPTAPEDIASRLSTLRDYLSTYTKAAHLHAAVPKGVPEYGFLSFSSGTARDAVLALEHLDIDGKPVLVRPIHTKPEKQRRPDWPALPLAPGTNGPDGRAAPRKSWPPNATASAYPANSPPTPPPPPPHGQPYAYYPDPAANPYLAYGGPQSPPSPQALHLPPYQNVLPHPGFVGYHHPTPNYLYVDPNAYSPHHSPQHSPRPSFTLPPQQQAPPVRIPPTTPHRRKPM